MLIRGDSERDDGENGDENERGHESALTRAAGWAHTNGTVAKEKQRVLGGYESDHCQDDDDEACQPGGAQERARIPRAGQPQIPGSVSSVF